MTRFLWASYGMYFLGGTTSVLLGVLMPELLIHYHVSYTAGGILALLGSLGFIAGVPITSSCMRHFHYRFILSAAALAVAVAQIGFLCLPPFFVLGILVVVNGIGAASLETAVASYIMEQFQGRRAIFMSRLEVAFGIGALSLPVFASIFIAIHWWRLTSLLIALIALALTVFWQTISYSFQSQIPSSDDGQRDAQTAAPPIFNGRFSKYGILLLFLLMILVYVGVEGSLNSFLPSIVTLDLKTKPSLASLSSTVFWGAMVLGRLAIGWIVRRVTYERYLFGSIVTGSMLFLVLINLNTPWLSYIVILGLGLSLSAVYSITMVYANHTFPGMERTVTSSVTAFAGVGGAVFPFVIGYTMDHFLPKQVLWLILSFIIVLLISFLVVYMSLQIIRRRYVARNGAA